MSPGRTRSPSPCKASADGLGQLIVTVRLFPRVHAVLIDEFANVGRRRRAARAAQLMTMGLMQERAHARPNLPPREDTPVAAVQPSDAAEPAVGAEHAAFVSAILDSSEN